MILWRDECGLELKGDMKGTCGIHSFLFPYHFELIHWFQPHAPKNLYAAGFDGLKRDAWLGDFAFMRAASHIAISPGTFSWWGAFFRSSSQSLHANHTWRGCTSVVPPLSQTDGWHISLLRCLEQRIFP